MVSTKHFIFMFSFKDFWFWFYHQDLFLVFFVLFLVFYLGNAHTTSWIYQSSWDHYRVSQSWFGV